jgi:pimeloyl-ACP methyl ester carboxylesterase
VQQRYFDIHGLRLAAIEWPGPGVPVIALHGWLDNAASFTPLAPYLEGAHLLALDLPGHGHSQHLPPSAGYHLADNCRWVVGLADAMGWQRFILLGHSMGAAIATITAAAVPQRLSGLALIDGLGPLALTPEQELARLQKLFSGMPDKPPRPFKSMDTAVKLRRHLGRFKITRDAARTIIERGMSATEEGGYLWRHDPRLKSPNTHYYSEEQVEGVLRGIEAQTLLVSADDGAFKGWRGFHRRKEYIGKLEHVVLPGGHHVHMEDPQAVAAVLNPCFARWGKRES